MPAAASPPGGSSGRAPTRRVLVVDDSPFLQQALAEALAEEFEVVQAWDGQEGLEAAERTRPDVVLLDLEMPRMGGLEACRKLRELPSLRRVPIVVLTASKSEAQARAAFEAGATDYLVKPFAPSLLRERLGEWIERLR